MIGPCLLRILLQKSILGTINKSIVVQKQSFLFISSNFRICMELKSTKNADANLCIFPISQPQFFKELFLPRTFVFYSSSNASSSSLLQASTKIYSASMNRYLSCGNP